MKTPSIDSLIVPVLLALSLCGCKEDSPEQVLKAKYDAYSALQKKDGIVAVTGFGPLYEGIADTALRRQSAKLVAASDALEHLVRTLKGVRVSDAPESQTVSDSSIVTGDTNVHNEVRSEANGNFGSIEIGSVSEVTNGALKAHIVNVKLPIAEVTIESYRLKKADDAKFLGHLLEELAKLDMGLVFEEPTGDMRDLIACKLVFAEASR